MRELLQKAGLKVTPARLLLLKTLKTLNRPTTIQSLLLQDSVASGMNTTTIYRSLENMVNAGLLYKTSFQAGVAHYEWQQSHHHHITCTECGLRDSIDCPDKTVNDKLISTKNFTSATTHVLEYFGTCNRCVV